jgi:hypothetical protein
MGGFTGEIEMDFKASDDSVYQILNLLKKAQITSLAFMS